MTPPPDPPRNPPPESGPVSGPVSGPTRSRRDTWFGDSAGSVWKFLGRWAFPLFVLLIAGVVRALNPLRGALALLAIAVLPLTYQLAAELDDGQRAFARSSALQALESAHVVVADHSRRGVLPRAVLHVSETRPLWIVRGPSNVDSLLAELRTRAIPVTFLLHREFGDSRVSRALAAARVPGDSLVTAGTLPAGTEVVVWSPRR